MQSKKPISVLGVFISLLVACGGGNSGQKQDQNVTAPGGVVVAGAVQKGPFVIGSSIVVTHRCSGFLYAIS